MGSTLQSILYKIFEMDALIFKRQLKQSHGMCHCIYVHPSFIAGPLLFLITLPASSSSERFLLQPPWVNVTVSWVVDKAGNISNNNNCYKVNWLVKCVGWVVVSCLQANIPGSWQDLWKGFLWLAAKAIMRAPMAPSLPGEIKTQGLETNMMLAIQMPLGSL